MWIWIYEQYPSCWLDVLGVHAFKYFLQFDLHLVIRNCFFLSGRISGDVSFAACLKFVLESPFTGCLGFHQTWWRCMSNNLFCRAFHQRHFKASCNPKIITSMYQVEIKVQKLFRRWEKASRSPQTSLQCFVSHLHLDLNLCLAVIPPFYLQSREALRRQRCHVFFINVLNHIADWTW